MSYKLTFSGQPFCDDTEELKNYIGKNLSLGATTTILPSRTMRGRLESLAFPLSPLTRPSGWLNTLYYPSWGCTRWSEFWGVMTRQELNAVEANCYSGNYGATNQSAPLVIQTANGTITTPMYMLPPKPLMEREANTNFYSPTDNSTNISDAKMADGLYLICLVDYRYFLQYAPAQTSFSCSSSWEGLLSQLASNAGINLSVNSVAGIYDHVERETFSDLNFGNGLYENVGLMLDAKMGC